MTALFRRNRNYRLLFSAQALTNLGDGMVGLALPWLAATLSRDPLAIAAVAAAGRLPWLAFSLPAGVIVDRADRKRLIARADLVRAAIVAAILWLALGPAQTWAVWLLAGLAFALGAAEVLRDNAAQTILPALVAPGDLEAANGQMWSAEQLTGQFIGPPLAGLLIGLGLGLPFGLDVAALALAAGLVSLIRLRPAPQGLLRFWPALREGAAHMWGDAALLRLAVVLGLANFLSTAVVTVQVLFAQDVLGIGAAGYGLLLSVQALGAVAGSLMAPWATRRFGLHPCLYAAIATWALSHLLAGASQDGVMLALALFPAMAASMLWNVITVSWRQRRIPSALLGRVNSIYRFFGWGSMPLGALAGGAVVAGLEPALGHDLALRAPFLLAGAGFAGLLAYALARLRLD